MYRLQAACRLQRDCTVPCTAYKAQILYFLSSEKITGADNIGQPCMHFNGGIPSVLNRIIHTSTEATSMAESPVRNTGTLVYGGPSQLKNEFP